MTRLPVACLALVAVSFVASPAAAQQKREIEHDGVARSYLVAPAGKRNAPIVILLHGGTQNARNVWNQTTLPRLARSEGFTLVAPDALDGAWNDGRTTYISGKDPTRNDDAGFILKVVEAVIASEGGNAARVFVTGASNGGYMSYRLACEHAGRFAGAAPVIAGLRPSPASWCRPARPIPMLAINGTEDRLMTYDGSLSTLARGEAVPHVSAPAAAAFWASNNRCSGSRQETPAAKGLEEATSVVITQYTGCAAATLLYTIVGGGHTWPNGPQPGPVIARFLGPTTRQIDAGQTIWSFFKRL